MKYLLKIKLEKALEDGKIAVVSEQYLTEAVNFADAELKGTVYILPFVSGQHDIVTIQRKNYQEIVPANWSINAVDSEANKIMGANKNQSKEADKWFECKLNFVALDEEKGVEKKVPVLMLVNANSTRSANDTLDEHMRKSMSDYEIEKIIETKIMDIIE